MLPRPPTFLHLDASRFNCRRWLTFHRCPSVRLVSPLSPWCRKENRCWITTNEKKEEWTHVLQDFEAPIRFSFAYGSAVFPQHVKSVTFGNAGTAGASPKPVSDELMVDLVFAVTHAQHWHSLNLRQHRDHYSAFGYLGCRSIQLLQEHVGASIYYNTDIPLRQLRMKYGVITVDDLCDDLLNWSTLYIAGRMHKPIYLLREDARVRLAQESNLKSAVRAALLYLPEEFSEEDFFMTLAGLSYTGDIRGRWGAEDPHKVYRLVHSQYADFQRMYQPVVDKLPSVDYKTENVLQQDRHPKHLSAIVRELPPLFRERLIEAYRRENASSESMEDLRHPDFLQKKIHQLCTSPDLAHYVTTALRKTIGWSSTMQTMKGLITAGFSKSIRYAYRKLKKGRK